MHALILAGGFGTRLQSSIGLDIPKPMALVAGEPFLARYLRRLAAEGVTQVVLSLHHLHEVISHYFGSNYCGMNIISVVEPQPLGTGGAIRYALSRVPAQGPVFVANGDSYTEIDLVHMLLAHRAAGRSITKALRHVDNCARYGQVMLDAGGLITAFDYPGRPEAGYISTGCYIIDPTIFDNIPVPEQFSFEADFIKPHCANLRPLGFKTEGYFIDIGIAEDFVRSQIELPARLP